MNDYPTRSDIIAFGNDFCPLCRGTGGVGITGSQGYHSCPECDGHGRPLSQRLIALLLDGSPAAVKARAELGDPLAKAEEYRIAKLAKKIRDDLEYFDAVANGEEDGAP